MRTDRFVLTVLVAASLVGAAAPAASQSGDPARLYGRVVTTDGSRYEGFIRWDPNEGSVFDILHGRKAIPDRNRRDAERLDRDSGRDERRFEIFGIGITLPGDGPSVSRSAQSGIRFGHISSLEVIGSDRARLLLKSGDEIELGGSADVGRSLDGVLVDDVRLGRVELEWAGIRSIDFLNAPAAASRWGERLYGTLRTRDGDRFTGYIAWDMDEIFGSDVLDGEERGRDHEIPFDQIRSLERYGSSATRVRRVDGVDVVLRGSNDVNSGNRDIMVADPELGEVRVEWDAFDTVEFEDPPSEAALDVFGGSGRIRGTVEARGGEVHVGFIRWDNDEEYGWEILDGELVDGVDLDVEFARIRAIERESYDVSLVTLRDGRSFRLTGSNDVDEGNRGIYVERDDGTVILVPWDRFERATFDG